MGWWSATVMGGDSPLDMIGTLAEVAGVGDYSREVDDGLLYGYPFTRRAVEDSLDRMVEAIEKVSYKPDVSIGYQVLGVIILHTGASITRELQARIIEQAKADEWYVARDEDRVDCINDFIKAMENHEAGRRTTLINVGLFGALTKAVEGKESRKVEISKERYVNAARALYHQDGRVEIDTDPENASNPAEGGCWVQAWVWVPDEDARNTETS